jgi:hypothetical protein
MPKKPDLYTVPRLYWTEDCRNAIRERQQEVAEKYSLEDPAEIAVFEVLDRYQGENGLNVYKVSYLARCILAELNQE